MLISLLTVAIGLLLIAIILAPLGSMIWFAGWGNPDAQPGGRLEEPGIAAPAQPSAAIHFMVYLSGIGAIAPNSIPEEELPFLANLRARLKGTLLIDNVFPYSVTNLGLTGQRFFHQVWRAIEKMRLQNPNTTLALLINLRNAVQVLVSADKRYGPIYNFGVAHEIYRKLIQAGYPVGSGIPVTLLGWSGGGQIAAGAAYYVQPWIHAPLRIISLGGVISDDVGLLQIEHLYHLYGTRDPLQGLGEKLFPGRWPIMPQSPWWRINLQGKISLINLGPFTHNGARNYFDLTTPLPGTTGKYADKTIQTIEQILAANGLIADRAASASRAGADPALAFAQAVTDTQTLIADETTQVGVAASGLTRLLSHGQVTDHVIVLLHGLTNSPQQFVELGKLFYQRGANVLIPRLPHHGLADRTTRDLTQMTPEELFVFVNQITNLAHGLGRQVTVAGLSLGGILAAWVAQNRADVDLAVPIAPMFGLAMLPPQLTGALATGVRLVPNFYLWWDPRTREASPYVYPFAYPGYPLHALAAVIQTGLMVKRQARQSAPAAQHIMVITNGNDRAVSNPEVYAVTQLWRGFKPARVRTFQFDAQLKQPHDLITPQSPGIKMNLVYAQLIELIMGNETA